MKPTSQHSQHTDQARPGATSAFGRLMTRLVFLDTTHQMIWGLAVVVMLQGFVSRYIPPWIIRDSIQTSSPHPRAIFLVVILLLYAAATRPLLAILLGSRRLQFMRHFPVHPRTWLRIHLTHLLLLNLLWFAVAWYAVLTGAAKHTPLPGTGWWLGWCAVTTWLQLGLYYARGVHRLWVWLACLALYPLFRWPLPWMGWPIAVLAGATLPLWLRLPPPQPGRQLRSWWPKRDNPVWLWLRIEWLTCWRRCRQALFVRHLWQWLFLAGMGLAIVNNAFQHGPTLYHIALGVLVPCAILGASIAIAIQRQKQSYGWWDAHLGATDQQLFRARWIIAFGNALLAPTLAVICILLTAKGNHSFGLRWGLQTITAGLFIGIWSSSLCLHLGWKAQLDNKLHEGIFWFLLVHAFPVLLGVIFFPFVVWGLPFLTWWYNRKSLQHLYLIRKLASFSPPPRATGYEHEMA